MKSPNSFFSKHSSLNHSKMFFILVLCFCGFTHRIMYVLDVNRNHFSFAPVVLATMISPVLLCTDSDASGYSRYLRPSKGPS